MTVSRADLHVLEAIAHVGISQFIQLNGGGIVRLNRHQRNAFAAIIIGQLFERASRKVGRSGSGCR